MGEPGCCGLKVLNVQVMVNGRGKECVAINCVIVDH